MTDLVLSFGAFICQVLQHFVEGGLPVPPVPWQGLARGGEVARATQLVGHEALTVCKFHQQQKSAKRLFLHPILFKFFVFLATREVNLASLPFPAQ